MVNMRVLFYKFSFALLKILKLPYLDNFNYFLFIKTFAKISEILYNINIKLKNYSFLKYLNFNEGGGNLRYYIDINFK